MALLLASAINTATAAAYGTRSRSSPQEAKGMQPTLPLLSSILMSRGRVHGPDH